MLLTRVHAPPTECAAAVPRGGRAFLRARPRARETALASGARIPGLTVEMVNHDDARPGRVS